MTESEKCPKCGSTELTGVDKSKLMCQNCYHVFEKDSFDDSSQTVSIRNEPGSRKCPFCMQMKPSSEFSGGICKDCADDYTKAVKKSQRDGKLIVKKAETQEALEGIAMLTSVFTRVPVDASPEEEDPEKPHASAPAKVVWKRVLIAVGITIAIPACYIILYFILKAMSVW